MSAAKPVDLFAQIAAHRDRAAAGLVRPTAAPVPKRILKADARTQPFRALPRISDAAGLARELARLRAAHRPFLRVLAPALPMQRPVQRLERFAWRIADGADLADHQRLLRGDGAWEQVAIPHYGAPLGRAATCYRAEFAADAALIACPAQALCFDGVDYIAEVFLNGCLLGRHEGIFAPFRFDVTGILRTRGNVLTVIVRNDGICKGGGGRIGDMPGDKLYAATGPGYDEPVEGWHHCPPGMGIWQGVRIEGLAPVHVSDLFVRPLPGLRSAEAWIEIDSWREAGFREGWTATVRVHGENRPGAHIRGQAVTLPKLGPGMNQVRVPLDLPRAPAWTPDAPWLLRLSVEIRDPQGNLMDAAARPFGMRTFAIDEEGEPKGTLLLNGREIRLRGANTMGYEQLRVVRGERDGLIDDLLLGKAARMNFLRITQRPVQREVYDLCDRLGILVQTDLPLFAYLRRTQFSEAIRQAGEMERLIRGHASCVLSSWINEPFPGSWGSQAHRHLTRPELESFMRCAAEATRIENPDRAIKPVDGDYDPPGPGLPDNHCYSLWYNAHGAPIGELHAGRWLPVKPGWRYACGEFGAEGLEDPELMRRTYPQAWLPTDAADEAAWKPSRIPYAQSWNMHYMFFDRPDTLQGWCDHSQAWQARATTLMTEAFRRHHDMVSIAIHLFIDAWPTGWMKTIMDVDRRPKRAFFAWRDALAPVHVHARTDRFAWTAGETVEAECWLCNDTHDGLAGSLVRWQAELDGAVIATGSAASLPIACGARPQGRIRVRLPAGAGRGTLVLRTRIDDARGKPIADHALELAVWPRTAAAPARPLAAIGSAAIAVAKELGLAPVRRAPRAGDAILVGSIADYEARRKAIDAAVAAGATAVLLPLPKGRYRIADGEIEITDTALGRYDFVSRATSHPLVAGFAPDDFRFWHDPATGIVTPLIAQVIEPAEGWTCILRTGGGQFWGGPGLHDAHAAAERSHGAGSFRLCQLLVQCRIATNPAARAFLSTLLG